MKFSRLREFITNSSIIIPSTPLITPTDKSKFSKYVGDIIDYSKKLNSLEIRPEVVFNVIDLDDTLYSRYPQLEMPLFSKNR
jgi:ribosome biogenesis GTPase A